jgi:hypothetical protein
MISYLKIIFLDYATATGGQRSLKIEIFIIHHVSTHFFRK